MKHLTLLWLFFASLSSYGQTQAASTRISPVHLTKFIDSLKTKITHDTIRFERKDLIHSNMGTHNTRPYSPLFIIDGKYEYLLDIVTGRLVEEFINEFLDSEKIKTIDTINADTLTTFGSKAVNGVILIETKEESKKRYDVAGLIIKNERPNNFDQRKDGELKILR